MKILLWSFLVICAIQNIFLFGQSNSKEFPIPLKTLPRISGAFGELRQGHLHRGIDLRTYGQNGLPIYSLGSGYVEAIYSSNINTGFGQAITILHDNGYRSTYAHLWAFENKKHLQKAFEFIEYLNNGGSFSLKLPKGWISIEEGEKIAYTGEKGSGVSHLHYEVQIPQGEYINPFPVLTYKNLDKTAPSILAISTEQIDFLAKGKSSNRCQPIKYHQNNYRCMPLLVTGLFGFKVVLWDQFNAVNPISVPKIELRQDGKKIYEILLDKLPLRDSLKPEKLYDIELSRNFSPYYAFRLFLKPSKEEETPQWLKTHENFGLIDTSTWLENEIRNFEIVVYDLVGNLTRIEVPVKKVRPSIPLIPNFNFYAGQKVYFKNSWLEVSSPVLKTPCFFQYQKRKPLLKERHFIEGAKHYIRWGCKEKNLALKVCVFSSYHKQKNLYENGKFLNLAYHKNKQAYCTELTKSGVLYLGKDKFPPKWDLSFVYGPLSQIQTYFILEDGESGVNPNQVDILVFGKKLSQDNIRRWGVYYDKDRKAFVFPSGFLPKPKEEARGTMVPISLRGYDQMGNPSKWLDALIEVNLANLSLF